MATIVSTTDLDALLTALEERVRRAVHAVQRLKSDNARLARELAAAESRAGDWQQRCTTWERDRDALAARLEHLLTNLDHLAHVHEAPEPSDDHDLAHRHS